MQLKIFNSHYNRIDPIWRYGLRLGYFLNQKKHDVSDTRDKITGTSPNSIPVRIWNVSNRKFVSPQLRHVWKVNDDRSVELRISAVQGSFCEDFFLRRQRWCGKHWRFRWSGNISLQICRSGKFLLCWALKILFLFDLRGV